jgi:hypothetical protein
MINCLIGHRPRGKLKSRTMTKLAVYATNSRFCGIDLSIAYRIFIQPLDAEGIDHTVEKVQFAQLNR